MLPQNNVFLIYNFDFKQIFNRDEFYDAGTYWSSQ